MYERFTVRERKVIVLHNTGSTNNDIKTMIQNANEPVFAVISARSQTGGRGRLGRYFFSPEGGLYFSVSFPLIGDEKNIPFITLLAGLATAEALEELTGVKTQLKWPNDIYFNGKKLGGILCELVSGKQLTAIVGIGINLTVGKEEIPPELLSIMTSFTIEEIATPDESALIKRITEKLDKYIYEKGELYDVKDITVEAICKRSYSIGKKVKYTVGDTVCEGIITNITKTGAAEIALPDGTAKEIFCGEITQ
ncbi:MAG: biotin--[Clostridia bacterium]|nr:biotin--[acetyl-CoA-carboxylase] ligase [Clostridia bacterium]